MHSIARTAVVEIRQIWPIHHAPLEPVINRHTPRLESQVRAGVAQLVERKALNLVVKGSSPFFGGMHFALAMSKQAFSA